MYYAINLECIPDELIKEIQSYLPNAREGLLFIRKDDLDLYSSCILLPVAGYEVINVDKLKEILILKHLKE